MGVGKGFTCPQLNLNTDAAVKMQFSGHHWSTCNQDAPYWSSVKTTVMIFYVTLVHCVKQLRSSFCLAALLLWILPPQWLNCLSAIVLMVCCVHFMNHTYPLLR